MSIVKTNIRSASSYRIYDEYSAFRYLLIESIGGQIVPHGYTIEQFRCNNCQTLYFEEINRCPKCWNERAWNTIVHQPQFIECRFPNVSWPLVRNHLVIHKDKVWFSGFAWLTATQFTNVVDILRMNITIFDKIIKLVENGVPLNIAKDVLQYGNRTHYYA